MTSIKVLGSGCANCKRLEATTRKVVETLGIEAEIEKVTDLGKIMGFGIMLTPALVVDGVVKVSGRVPDVAEMKRLLA